MGRPREHDDDTREQLLVAAGQLLATDGPAALSCFMYSAVAPTTPCHGDDEFHAGRSPPKPPPPPYVPPFPTPRGAKDVLMVAVDDMRPVTTR